MTEPHSPRTRRDTSAHEVAVRRTRLVVDSDGGVDDIAALWYLLTEPHADVVGITTTGGNVPVGKAADNLARVCELAEVEVPIALGDEAPFGPHPSLRSASFIHGSDGVGDTGRRPSPWTRDQRSVVDLIADAVADHRDDLTLLTLGPLTNVARFVTECPDLVGGVQQLVVMGGTVTRQGNALPIAEANIAHDPSAAALVATAPWTHPPLLVGLDVTLAATLTEHEYELLAEERNDAARDLHAPLTFYRRHGSTFSEPGECPCHDLTAAIAALEPHLVTAPELALGVDTSGGLGWGATVVDRRRPYFERAGADAVQALPSGMAEWRVALEADVEGFRERYRKLLGDPSRATVPPREN